MVADWPTFLDYFDAVAWIRLDLLASFWNEWNIFFALFTLDDLIYFFNFSLLFVSFSTTFMGDFSLAC